MVSSGRESRRDVASGVSTKDDEVAHRRDEALRRALNTPPKPRKDDSAKPKKPTTGKGGRRVGKP